LLLCATCSTTDNMAHPLLYPTPSSLPWSQHPVLCHLLQCHAGTASGCDCCRPLSRLPTIQHHCPLSPSRWHHDTPLHQCWSQWHQTHWLMEIPDTMFWYLFCPSMHHCQLICPPKFADDNFDLLQGMPTLPNHTQNDWIPHPFLPSWPLGKLGNASANPRRGSRINLVSKSWLPHTPSSLLHPTIHCPWPEQWVLAKVMKNGCSGCSNLHASPSYQNSHVCGHLTWLLYVDPILTGWLRLATKHQ